MMHCQRRAPLYSGELQKIYMLTLLRTVAESGGMRPDCSSQPVKPHMRKSLKEALMVAVNMPSWMHDSSAVPTSISKSQSVSRSNIAMKVHGLMSPHRCVFLHDTVSKYMAASVI